MSASLEFNPALPESRQFTPPKEGGNGTIHKPGDYQNLIWQTRSRAPESWELSLIAQLETLFEQGVETLPALVERAGNGVQGGGSITAFYTVLTEGDDQQDPIADSARAILDGHVVLSRRLAEAGHYPAIDIEASISRAMTELIAPSHYKKVQRFKQLLSAWQRNRDLISVGAYAAGSDPLLDKAITLYPQMEGFLQQGIYDCSDYETSFAALSALFPDLPE